MTRIFNENVTFPQKFLANQFAKQRKQPPEVLKAVPKMFLQDSRDILQNSECRDTGDFL